MDLRYFEVPIGALDTATDATSLPPGALTIADNCSADTPGVYEHRKGYTSMGPGQTIMRLASRSNQLFAVGTRGRLWVFDGLATWRQSFGIVGGGAAGVGDAQTSQTNIHLNQTADITKGTRCTTNGITVHAFVDGSFLIVRLERQSTGEVVFESIGDNIGVSFLHAAAAGNLVAIVYTHTTQVLKSIVVDTANLTVAATATLVSGANVSATNPFLDVCPLNGTQVLVVWQSNTPNLRVGLLTVSTSTFAAGPTVMSAEVPDSGIAIAGTTGEFGAIIYHSTAAGGVRAACFNVATTAQTVAPFMVENVTAPVGVNVGLTRVDATHVLCVWDRAASGLNKQKIQWVQIDSAGGVGALRGPLFNVALASKPFAGHADYGTSFKALNVWAPYSLQYTFFTVRLPLSSGAPFCYPSAMHAYRGAYKSAQITGQLTDVDTVGTNAYAFSGAIAYKYLSTSTPRAGWSTFGVDYAAATLFRNVEAIGDAFISAGVGSKFDGSMPVEMNFLLYPEITAATPGAVGAGGMDNGTYSYVLVFEFTDASGNTDRSTTAVPVQATTSAGAGLGKVTLQFDNLTLTHLGANVSAMGNVAVFRTLAGGTTYRHVASVQMNAALANNTYVDQAHDNTISSNRVLYTDGGVLDREPPPASLQFLVHRNRIWGISSADRRVLFYSGELGPGEAPWFSSLQQVRVDAGGDITAIASMDDKLVVFKSDRIFKIYGSGMNALGQANDLSPALPMNTDAGATDWRSAVQMGDGTMYRNRKGIQILVRGEETAYLGAPVETYVDAAANVTAAAMLADAREVRFELDTGKKVVLNYGTKRWTTHTNDGSVAAVDAIVVGGRYYWATAAGAVYREKLSTDVEPFMDPSGFAPMTIEFAWIAPAGKQGIARVRNALLLAASLDPHDVTITTSVNYDTVTAPLVSALTGDQIAALPREQIRVTFTSQKLQSMRVKVVDGESAGVASTVTGQGYKLRGLGFMAGVKKGAFDKRMVNAAKV